MAVTKFGYGYLELCEVSVYANDIEPLPWEKNVALGKRTYMIEVMNRGKEVDGILFNYNSCTYSKKGSNWWMVDLGKDSALTRVRLHNRVDGYYLSEKIIIECL